MLNFVKKIFKIKNDIKYDREPRLILEKSESLEWFTDMVTINECQRLSKFFNVTAPDLLYQINLCTQNKCNAYKLCLHCSQERLDDLIEEDFRLEQAYCYMEFGETYSVLMNFEREDSYNLRKLNEMYGAEKFVRYIGKTRFGKVDYGRCYEFIEIISDNYVAFTNNKNEYDAEKIEGFSFEE